jgi:RimJ/RimL family protein N-acetyltransferase
VKFDYQLLRLETGALSLAYFHVPWDSDIFGFPVAQIAEMRVLNPALALADLAPFRAWLDHESIRLTSCRLPHERLHESMLLEQIGFRFVEMVLHPHLADLQAYPCAPQKLSVELADSADLPAIEAIAAHAFGHERFHVDPRLDRTLANHRYLVWVRNSHGHPTHRLYKICDGADLVAFFVTENKPDGLCYWHLTAISPAFQGRGYGKRVWLEMLHYHQREGMARIGTTIAACNTTVLNLYASLDFRFQPPEITLHWMPDA